MPLRFTTVIAPLASPRRSAVRSNPFAAAMRGIGIGTALLVIGLCYLLLAPFFWCARKIAGLRAGSDHQDHVGLP